MTSILQGVNNQSHFKNSKWPQNFPSLFLSRVSELRGLRILPLKYTNKIWCYIIFECSDIDEILRSSIVYSINICHFVFFFSFFFLSMKKVGDSMEKVGDSIGENY
jgi:hypothetical protein